MGLLDDAIKDHLELKRRHGADPTEVARLEHEALGPARREPAAAVAPAPDERAVMDQDDFEDAAPLEDDVLVDDPDADDTPLLDDDGYDDEVIADERLDAPLHRAHAAPREPEAAEPEATVEQPTRQFSLHELEDATSEGEDVPEAPAEPEDAAQAPAEAEDARSDAEAAPTADPEPHADVVPADEEPDPDDVLEETPEFLQETPEHDRLWFEQKPPRDFDF
jgi:hypothetical protein